MQSKLKQLSVKIIAVLLLIATMLSYFTIPAFANDYDGGSGGEAAGVSGKGYTWLTNRTGYRVTVVDNQGIPVAKPVDFVFSFDKLENAKKYYDCKTESSGSRASANERLGAIGVTKGSAFSSTIPEPILWVMLPSGKEGAKANEGALKNWMTANNNRNITALLNCKEGDRFVFSLPGVSNEKSPAKVVDDNNYIVLIELIIWFEPYSSTQGTYGQYVYGTLQNLSDWYLEVENKGFIKPWSRYSSMMLSVAPWALHLEEYLQLGSNSIDAVSPGNGNVSVGELTDHSKGYSMHRFKTKEGNPTHTYDDPAKDGSTPPAPAPDPVTDTYSDIKPDDPSLHYRIVKTYQDGQIDSLGNETYIHVATYERYPTVNEILIEDEKPYFVVEYKWGNPYVKTDITTEWTDPKIANVVPIGSGNNSNVVVDIADPSNPSKETTLYVLLRKPAPDNSTHTWDKDNYPSGDTPHPAPDIKVESPETPPNLIKYRIVKTYEEEIKDVNGNISIQHVSTTVRFPTVSKITIEHEPVYKVIEWKSAVNYETVSSSTKWDDSPIASKTAIQSGKSPTFVNIADVNDANREVTLYVRLRKPAVQITTGTDGEVTLSESQISKALQTIDGSVRGWTAQTMTFTAPSLSGTCGYTWDCGSSDCGGHTCGASYQMQDSGWHYYAMNTIPVNLEIMGNVGVFAPKMEGDQSGSRGTSAHSKDISTFNMLFTIWRAKDIPTIASYKENESNPIVTLTNRYGRTPQGLRFGNSTGDSYTLKLKIELDKDGSLGDYYTQSGHHDETMSANHSNINTLSYNADATVRVYWGKQNPKGVEYNKTPTPYQTTIIGKSGVGDFGMVTYSQGITKQYRKNISFYPYVRMSYQTTGTTPDINRTNVNVLSQFLSDMTPSDYVESAWITNSDYNLNIRSSQWSLHAKATGGNKYWNYSNTVLPGGAILSLDMKDTKTYVSTISWQPYLEKEILDKVVIDGKDFTLEATKNPHAAMAEEAKNVLESWRVVQHVKKLSESQWKDYDLRKALSDTAINRNYGLDGTPILGGGQSISLGGASKTSTEDKYYFKADTSGKNTNANDGDLDIISERLITTKYRVSADISGNIKIERMREPDVIVSGQLTANPGSDWVTIQTLKKDQGADSLLGEALDLDQRTKIITNLCTVLTRNSGDDDSADWVADNHWFNEAQDGICYIRQETQFEVGFKAPNQRSSALDPNLTPSNAGQSDLYSTASLSQFFLNATSDAAQASGKSEGYIASFKGSEVILPHAKEMIRSRPISIPNATVQDLN